MATAGRILIIPKGKYNTETQYEMLDLVSYGGKGWVCKKTCKGIAPTEGDYWAESMDANGIIDEALGSADISKIGDGSVRGAISAVNNEIGTVSEKTDDIAEDVANAQLTLDEINESTDVSNKSYVGYTYNAETGYVNASQPMVCNGVVGVLDRLGNNIAQIVEGHNEVINDLKTKNLKTYTSITQLNLSSDNTMDEVMAALPLNSELVYLTSKTSSTLSKCYPVSTAVAKVTYYKGSNYQRGYVKWERINGVDDVRINRYSDGVFQGWKRYTTVSDLENYVPNSVAGETIGKKCVEVGINDEVVVYASLCLKKISATKCDVYINYKIASNPLTHSNVYRFMSMQKIKEALGISSLACGVTQTQVTFIPSFDSASGTLNINTVENDAEKMGYVGCLADVSNTEGIGIGRIHTTSGSFGLWALNSWIYKDGTYGQINIYGADYTI